MVSPTMAEYETDPVVSVSDNRVYPTIGPLAGGLLRTRDCHTETLSRATCTVYSGIKVAGYMQSSQRLA